jgi:hypothetical protein
MMREGLFEEITDTNKFNFKTTSKQQISAP